MMESTLRDAVSKLERAKKSGVAISVTKTAGAEYLPIRVTSKIEPGREFGTVQSEIVVGRGFWLFSLKRALNHAAKVLHNHHWSILAPPGELTWFTSDDPVIRLNLYPNGKYDFNGGWVKARNQKSFLPLDPHSLLYTRIGERPERRVSVVSRDAALLIRRFIAERAHRFIFSASADDEVPRLRPRIVDADRVRDEAERWRKWHEDQTLAEQELIAPRAGHPPMNPLF